MIWEIVKAGVYAWNEHKIIGFPFFTSTLLVSPLPKGRGYTRGGGWERF